MAPSAVPTPIICAAVADFVLLEKIRHGRGMRYLHGLQRNQRYIMLKTRGPFTSQATDNVDFAVQAYLAAGMPAHKIVVGIRFG